MNKMIVFVDSTKKAPDSPYVALMKRLGWWVLAISATIAFLIFVYRPDYLILPPGIK